MTRERARQLTLPDPIMQTVGERALLLERFEDFFDRVRETCEGESIAAWKDEEYVYQLAAVVESETIHTAFIHASSASLEAIAYWPIGNRRKSKHLLLLTRSVRELGENEIEKNPIGGVYLTRSPHMLYRSGSYINDERIIVFPTKRPLTIVDNALVLLEAISSTSLRNLSDIQRDAEVSLEDGIHFLGERNLRGIERGFSMLLFTAPKHHKSSGMFP